VCWPSSDTENEDSNGSSLPALSLRTHSPVSPSVFTRYSVKSTPEAPGSSSGAVTLAVPVMPLHAPPENDEWSLHT
jgi:hypothetical protein